FQRPQHVSAHAARRFSALAPTHGRTALAARTIVGLSRETVADRVGRGSARPGALDVARPVRGGSARRVAQTRTLLARRTHRARCQVLASLLRRRADTLPPDPDAQHEIEKSCCTLARGDGSADDLGRAASDSVAEALASYVAVADRLPKPAIEHDQVVWATA